MSCTVAPGKTALVGSVTIPAKVAVVRCATLRLAIPNTASTTSTTFQTCVRISSSSVRRSTRSGATAATDKRLSCIGTKFDLVLSQFPHEDKLARRVSEKESVLRFTYTKGEAARLWRRRSPQQLRTEKGRNL